MHVLFLANCSSLLISDLVSLLDSPSDSISLLESLSDSLFSKSSSI